MRSNAFKRANQLDPKDTVSICMIGYVMEQQGNQNEAMKYYAQRLRVKPDDEMATKLMALGRHGRRMSCGLSSGCEKLSAVRASVVGNRADGACECVRRGKVLSILTVLLVLAGVACVARDARRLFRQIDTSYITFLGAGFLLLGATAGCLTIAIFRKDCRRLTVDHPEFLQGRPATGLRRCRRQRADPAGLRRSTSWSTSPTRASPTRRMKLKELEIQLKVATAERQHAEAIIYSISDAVLVTDPFDDLVLANESAARTFEFDLQQVTRTARRSSRCSRRDDGLD